MQDHVNFAETKITICAVNRKTASTAGQKPSFLEAAPETPALRAV